ncbi:hypothetical protein L6472_06195 [Prevotella sp. E13-17]|uniref:hypothetical protein n=1 Tax=Prevotella sp. E13-17 TaxID=2913616 RepID=UPI001EDA7C17|nr:hypothetical protein [Prevotella sp. E13-17]UKK52169.1 hypothetical protein L6472_06195 [Prevotella sp. E13-17]
MPIPLAVPLAMAGASLVSSIFGGAKSAKAAREQARMIANEKAKLEAERLRKQNEDYLDTAAGQNLMRIARQERDKMWKREQGAAAVGGATDAAVAMAKEQGNNMIADTVANIAAQDTARKDNIDASYRSDIARLSQQQIEAEGANADAISQTAAGAASDLRSAALSTFGGTKLGQSWLGTSGGTTQGSNSWFHNNGGIFDIKSFFEHQGGR